MSLSKILARAKDVDPDHVLLTDKETGIVIGGENNPVATGTLANWRTSGRHGLKFIKVGSLVRYRLSDVQAWLKRHESDAEVA